MGSILLALILGHLSTAILVISYTAKHNKSGAVRLFLLSKLFQPTAWIMFWLRVVTPSMVLKSPPTRCCSWAWPLELLALLQLKDCCIKAAKKTYAALLIACFLVFAAASAYDLSESVRIAVASIMGALLVAYPPCTRCSRQRRLAAAKSDRLLLCRGRAVPAGPGVPRGH